VCAGAHLLCSVVLRSIVLCTGGLLPAVVQRPLLRAQLLCTAFVLCADLLCSGSGLLLLPGRVLRSSQEALRPVRLVQEVLLEEEEVRL